MEKSNDSLSATDFDRLRVLIRAECGINLGPEKRTMLEIRLKRRQRDLHVPSPAAYCAYLFSPEGKARELLHMIDAVTTNKTDFFREPDHFEYLASTALPELESRKRAGRIMAWSAGCSTGEEPYTLAMVLSEFAHNRPGFSFGVLATDISSEVLAKAGAGIFRSDAVRPVPPELRKKYLMRSRDPQSDLVRVVPELRSKIEFRRLNFMDGDYRLAESPSIIFCRNVIIYFDRPTQIRLLKRLSERLAPGGYFFAGHSESLQNMDLPLLSVGPAVYRKST
ncbi:MAG: protein-glutamate O-methyltransferase [Bryobacteraceae bacterium]|jgi:chemotaxis protein methyltransferase CheR